MLKTRGALVALLGMAIGMCGAPVAGAAERSGGALVPTPPAQSTTAQPVPAGSPPQGSTGTAPSESSTVSLTPSQVRSVQRRVGVRADGTLGARTRAALGRYQAKHRLKPTGRPNIETLRAMRLKLAERLADELASRTVPPGTSAAAVVAAARAQVGVPYLTAGTTPSGFDCSGLTVHTFKQAGAKIPRVSFDQYEAGTNVPRSEVRPGDLVFFDTDGPGASHVGIATGTKTVISATTSRGVVEHRIDDSYWGAHYLGARRLVG